MSDMFCSDNANLIIGGIILWNCSTQCLLVLLLWNYSSKERSEPDKKYISWLQSSHLLPVSASPSVPSQNKTIYSADLICEGKVSISRYCFPRRKFVKIRLTGCTTSHLLQTPVINYEFNNHLSTMLCVINRSAVSASCNLFSGQEV